MNRLLQQWEAAPETAIRDIAVAGCAVVVLVSVAWSFAHYHQRRAVIRGKSSVVDTFTMLLFFLVYCRLVGSRVGALREVAAGVRIAALIAGLMPLLAGCVVNLLGRHQLGADWANQIAIYQGHRLSSTGMFALVRHPLYASLIWMFLGASVAYLNWAALLLTLLVFVPAMAYRAGQEERLLQQTFPDYAEYRKRTGAFFPKLRSLRSRTL